jgi:hypothetical protein
MEMLKDFKIEKYLNKKPPSNDSFTTMQELKDLAKITINKSFAKEKDDIEKVFAKIVDEKKLVKQLMEESIPIIKKIKNHHDRPRPSELAKKKNIKLGIVDLKSAKTPSYPSGHTAQAYLIGMVLSDKHSNKKQQLMKAAKDISRSRNIARLHYKSDLKFGEQIGRDMYNHIKNKI